MSEYLIRNDGTELFCFSHESGLKCTNILKETSSLKFLSIVINYGWVYNKLNNKFKEEVKNIPFGTAHLLEHVVLNELNERLKIKGCNNIVNFNARTEKDKTTYEFVVKDNMESTILLIVNNFLSLDIRNDIICKEKNIVLNEYFNNKGNFERQALINLLTCMFGEKCIGEDPLGDEESISTIERNILREVYENIYTFSNLELIIVGKVDVNSLINKLFEEQINFRKSTMIVEGHCVKPNLADNNSVTIRNSFLKNDIFAVSFRSPVHLFTSKQFFKIDICLKILLEILILKINNNSKCNNWGNLYGGVFTNGELGYLYLKGAGNVKSFLEILNIVLDEIDSEILENSQYNYFIEQFIKKRVETAISEIDLFELANSVAFHGNIIEYLSCYNEITLECLREIYNNFFDRKNIYVSIISCN